MNSILEASRSRPASFVSPNLPMHHRARKNNTINCLFMCSNLFADPVDESRAKRSGDNDDEECIASPTILQADLRFGTRARHFTLEKHAKNLEQCKAACCSSERCDVAYLKDEECYSVDCVDEDSCLWVNSDDHNVNTAIVYLTRTKTKLHHKKGIVDILYLVYSNSQL